MGDGLGPAISSHRADQQAEGARDPLAAREPGMQTVSEVAASLVLTITAGRGRVPLPLAALTAQLQHMLEAGGYGAAESAAATFQAVYGWCSSLRWSQSAPPPPPPPPRSFHHGRGCLQSDTVYNNPWLGGMHRGVEEEEVALSVETLHDSLHQIESLGDPAELAEGGLNKVSRHHAAPSVAPVAALVLRLRMPCAVDTPCPRAPAAPAMRFCSLRFCTQGQSGSSAQSAAAAMKGGDSFSSFDADDDDGGDGLLSDGKPTADSEPPASKSKLGAASS